MAIAFCSACDRLVYIGARDSEECPVCSGPLRETEEVIKKRTIYLETSPPDIAVVTDLPAQKSESQSDRTERRQKEGRP